MIKEKQELLEENHKSQEEETDVRREENAEYQKVIATFQLSQTTIAKAKKVLEKFYEGIKEEEELLLAKRKKLWKKASRSLLRRSRAPSRGSPRKATRSSSSSTKS